MPFFLSFPSLCHLHPAYVESIKVTELPVVSTPVAGSGIRGDLVPDRVPAVSHEFSLFKYNLFSFCTKYIWWQIIMIVIF